MRRILALLCVLIIAFSSGSAQAADVLYRMLHADEVESFRRDQDAIIVGQLIERLNSSFLVEVNKVISGKVESQYIEVSDDFQYGWGKSEMKPEVNDYCVMSLKRTGTVYKKAWGVFKADSGDYRTLRLLTEETGYYYGEADAAAIQWFVNSGGTENDFYFEGSSVFVSRPNGERLQIYSLGERLKIERPVVSERSEEPGGSQNSNITYFFGLPAAFLGLLIAALIKDKKKIAESVNTTNDC